MTKRLQVLLKDPEYREIRRAARSHRMSIAEWVRQALDAARREQPADELGKKLAAVRAAVSHEFPVSDIGKMLEEIEQGYVGSERP